MNNHSSSKNHLESSPIVPFLNLPLASLHHESRNESSHDTSHHRIVTGSSTFRPNRKLSDWVDMSSHEHAAEERTSIDTIRKRDHKFDDKNQESFKKILQ